MCIHKNTEKHTGKQLLQKWREEF